MTFTWQWTLIIIDSYTHGLYSRHILWMNIRTALFQYECNLIGVCFKRVIQTQCTLFFSVEKKLCKDPQTYRWSKRFLFDVCFGKEIPSSNLALSLACHSWIATFWRPTMQRMKSQVYIPCVEGLDSESASTELQVSRSLWWDNLIVNYCRFKFAALLTNSDFPQHFYLSNGQIIQLGFVLRAMIATQQSDLAA